MTTVLRATAGTACEEGPSPTADGTGRGPTDAGGARRPQALATALIRAREAACLTQEELAERSGLSVRAIRNLETGHTARPRKQSLRLLATALRLPPAASDTFLRLPRDEGPPAPGGPEPAELPAAPRHRLVGREELVEALRTDLTRNEPAQRPAVVVGPAGAGKTAVVLRAAHGVCDHFPDGQVFVDLHPGSSPPMTADTLVRRVLRSVGRAATGHPEEDRAQLRNTLSKRRVLVVLDNVDSEAQVRPLLVDGGRSAVLVAARRELSALPAQSRRAVGALGQQDAYQLLEDLVGAARARPQRSAALSIVQSCTRLPLALHIAGLWLTARPHRSLRDLADRLVDERHRLDSLVVGDLSLQVSVTAYFRQLPPPVRASLCRLEAIRGDFGVEEMAVHVTPSRRLAVDLLEELTHRQMVYVSTPDRDGGTRYRLHDATRLYVSHLVEQERTRRTATPTGELTPLTGSADTPQLW
ncbi:NB-ARC domain-containing protein [Streptomyces parvus]|uniref:NB-ARC domain-containing protein n=1 Tax=Streptomyces parvus TaxID=66428 RepID=UPI00341B7684